MPELTFPNHPVNPYQWRLDLYEDLKAAGLLYAIDVNVPEDVIQKIRESRQASPGI